MIKTAPSRSRLLTEGLAAKSRPPPLNSKLRTLNSASPKVHSASMPPLDWHFPYPSQRMPVFARNVVATSQPLAAQAGLQVLKDGGNAADAAVTTAAMLGVVEPESAGIGGDMEAIYYSAADHKLYGLNAAGWAPASATPAFYHQNGYDEVPAYGAFSATVPGAVDGWARFLNRFGTISLADALEPSIETARQGFGLTERIRGDWDSYHGFYVDMLKQDPESSK